MAKWIKTKLENGKYVYEYDVIHNHLSKQQADDFIYPNADWEKSRIVYLYGHVPKKGKISV